MGSTIKRTRDSNNAVTTLNLESATASDRRLDVTAATDSSTGGTRFFGFYWVKSTTAATDITISRVAADGGTAFVLAQRLGDTGTTGLWRPEEEEVTGRDVVPSATHGDTYRVQFSQAGSTCTAEVVAAYKEV